jgi:hypothetical protein
MEREQNQQMGEVLDVEQAVGVGGIDLDHGVGRGRLAQGLRD